MVELQHATKSLLTFNVAGSGTNILTRFNQLIAQSLMVPLRVVMLHILTNGLLK